MRVSKGLWTVEICVIRLFITKCVCDEATCRSKQFPVANQTQRGSLCPQSAQGAPQTRFRHIDSSNRALKSFGSEGLESLPTDPKRIPGRWISDSNLARISAPAKPWNGISAPSAVRIHS